MTTGGASERILTPDQRPRVFISSTLQELAAEREAARDAIEGLRLIPVMFELGARPHPARALYRAYLAQSHVFVGVYHERYGWVAPGEEQSGLEDEYHLSGVLPRLVYLKAPAPGRESRLSDLLDVIRTDDTVSYKSFGDAEQLQQLLRDDLAVLLAERFLVGGADAAETAPSSPPAPVRVPRPPGELFGREEEVAGIAAAFESGDRLVTVVGSGGIGKTRVALEAMHRAAEVDPYAVACVPLEAVTDPEAVLPAIAARIGVPLDGGAPALEALATAFADRPYLLLLDNLEQVLPAAVELASLLEMCPRVSLLVTSRAALRLRGERLLRVGPLALPDDAPTDVPSHRTQPAAALQLFVDRARSVRPDFALDDPDEHAAVVELCRRLDGIPLAIEIAAARSAVLPPRALLERIGSALDLGSGAADLPPRQRTLRDTLAWSEALLTAGQRDLLARLSMFAAPWTLADAEAVAGPVTLDALDDLAGLVENSLVQPMPGVPGEPRFLMYETVRAFAADRLAAAEVDAVEAAYVARTARQVDHLQRAIRTPAHARWRAEARLIWPDVRHAWELALTNGDAVAVADLILFTVPLWLDGRSGVAAPLVEATLEHLDDYERTEPAAYGEVLLAAATWTFHVGDYERTAALLDRLEASGAAPARDTARGVRQLLRGYLAAQRGDLEECSRLLTECVETLREGDDAVHRWIEAFAHNGLGSVLLAAGDPVAADAEYTLSREAGRESGNIGAEMQALVFAAAHRIETGRLGEARDLLASAADLIDQQPYYEGDAYGLEVAALYALAAQDAAAAARAVGMSDELRKVAGVRIWGLLEPLSARVRHDARARLGEDYEQTVEAGRRLDPRAAAEMIRELLALDTPDATGRGSATYPPTGRR